LPNVTLFAKQKRAIRGGKIQTFSADFTQMKTANA
jgi:hypothetical protein